MLVLLLGASGVGKSTIAKLLVDSFGWRPLISWITRPERDDEEFKVAVSNRSYEMLKRHNMLWSDVQQNGHSYGLLRLEVQQAIRDMSALYVVDYGLASRQKYFLDHPHLPVLIAPDQNAALERRLRSAGRLDRLSGALTANAELQEWFETEGSKAGAQRVPNPEGDPRVAAMNVDRLARVALSSITAGGQL